MEPEDIVDSGPDKSSRKRKSSPNPDEPSHGTPTKVLKTDRGNAGKDDSVPDVKQTFSEQSTSKPDHHTGVPDHDSSSVQPCDRVASDRGCERGSERVADRPKRQRKRTKFLIQSVLDQMEFYFSDSNLSKDRFLKQMLDRNKEGYIDISVFGNFNKLQQLHKDGVSSLILKKALKRSKILTLNEDGSQVRRLTPFKEISKEETDRRTIYVENLPSKASHAWLRTLFSQSGRVVYVSLPKYKTTKDIKGFAFVEFQTAEEAAKACLLNDPPPEKAQEKAGRFPKFNKTLNRLQKLVPTLGDPEENDDDNVSDDPKSSTESKKKKKKKGKKRKAAESASEEKIGVGNAAMSETDPQEVKKKKKKKKKKRTNSTSLDDDAIRGDLESFNEDDSRVSEKDESLNESETMAEAKTDLTDDDSMQANQKDISNDEVKMTGGVGKDGVGEDMKESNDESKTDGDSAGPKKRKRKRKKKGETKGDSEEVKETVADQKENVEADAAGSLKTENSQKILSRKERKRLRQEDIRRKKMERECKEEEEMTGVRETVERETGESLVAETGRDCLRSISLSSQCTDSEAEDRKLKRDGSQVTSILKSKRQSGNKRVEFDPVPVTQEYVKVKDARRRKRLRKEKVHLRIISKREWDNLRAEYIKQQKSHMAALKESLRELKQQECQGQTDQQGPAPRHVDLEDVFGTKRLKPTRDVKMAHVEALEFTPNVIVQWKIAHEMPRDKIRALVNTLGSELGQSIAYIDSEEEAKTGYIRFKDEKSAEIFTRTSRNSDFISARLLPVDQQQAYWDKANQDRMKRLGRKKKEKGSEKLARKVFERNKETFLRKPNRIVFADEEEESNSLEKRIITDFSEEDSGGNKSGRCDKSSHSLNKSSEETNQSDSGDKSVQSDSRSKSLQMEVSESGKKSSTPDSNKATDPDKTSTSEANVPT